VRQALQARFHQAAPLPTFRPILSATRASSSLILTG
jgi:hypothetical protein